VEEVNQVCRDAKEQVVAGIVGARGMWYQRGGFFFLKNHIRMLPKHTCHSYKVPFSFLPSLLFHYSTPGNEAFGYI
jgi:hypothetical protein